MNTRKLSFASVPKLCVIAFALLLSLGAPSQALDLPAVVDEYRLLVKEWELRPPVPKEPRYQLVVRGNSFPIEPKFIAQSVRGNSVLASDVDSVFSRQLKEVMEAKGTIMLKVASLEANGPLFVRSLKLFDFEDSYQRALNYGSPILNLEAADVRKLSFGNYSESIERLSDKEWRRLECRDRQPK